MKTYTIVLNAAQQKAMEHIALDVNEWIQNVVFNRVSLAVDEIVSIEVERKLAIGESIVGNKEEIVLQSVLPNAADREATAENDREARRNQKDSKLS